LGVKQGKKSVCPKSHRPQKGAALVRSSAEGKRIVPQSEKAAKELCRGLEKGKDGVGGGKECGEKIAEEH